MSRGTTKKQRRLAASDHSPIAGLIRLKEHFFGGRKKAIDRLIDDPRDRARITYGQPVLIHMAGMKSMNGVVSMQGRKKSFNTASGLFLLQNRGFCGILSLRKYGKGR